MQPDDAVVQRASETFDLLAFLLVEMYAVEQLGRMRTNLHALFPMERPRSGGEGILSRQDGDVYARAYQNVGRIWRVASHPPIWNSRVLPNLPAEVEFIDVFLHQLIPTHIFLSLEVALSTAANDTLFELLGRPYEGEIEISDFRPWRVAKSVTFYSPETEKQETIAAYVEQLIRDIQHSLEPYLNGGLFTEDKDGEGLARADVIAIRGLPDAPGQEAAAWQATAREWSSSLGLLLVGGYYSSKRYAVIPRSGGIGLENLWQLVVRPEHFADDWEHEDRRSVILRELIPVLGGFSAVIALDRFATMQQKLVARFRRRVLRAASAGFLAYLLFFWHLLIHQRILTARVIVQGLQAGLSRSAAILTTEPLVSGCTTYLCGTTAEHEPDPFIGFIVQRLASIREGMDLAAQFFAELLAARNLAATYVLSILILLATIFGAIDLSNLQGRLARQPAPHGTPTPSARATRAVNAVERQGRSLQR